MQYNITRECTVKNNFVVQFTHALSPEIHTHNDSVKYNMTELNNSSTSKYTV